MKLALQPTRTFLSLCIFLMGCAGSIRPPVDASQDTGQTDPAPPDAEWTLSSSLRAWIYIPPGRETEIASAISEAGSGYRNHIELDGRCVWADVRSQAAWELFEECADHGSFFVDEQSLQDPALRARLIELSRDHEIALSVGGRTRAAVSSLAGLARLQGLSVFPSVGGTQPFSPPGRGAFTFTEALDEASADSIDGISFIARLSLASIGIAQAGPDFLAGHQELVELHLFGTGASGLPHLERLTRLHTLSLTGQTIRPGDLAALRSMPDLRRLDLARSSFAAVELTHLRGMTELHTLSLALTPLGDSGLAQIGSLTGLRVLVMPPRVTDDGLAHLAPLTQLESLSAYASDTAISDAGLVHLRDLTRLRTLELMFSQVTGPGLAHLAAMGSLRELDLRETPLTDAGLAHLPPLRELEVIRLPLGIGDAGLSHLHGLSGLRELDLQLHPVTNEGLVHLRPLTSLRVLLLPGDVTDAGLANVRGLHQLRELVVSVARITDAGLAHLAGLRELRRLHISGSQITDAGLAHLSGLAQLETLSLESHIIGSAGLEHLTTLSGLRSLNLGSTCITDHALPLLLSFPQLEELLLNDSRLTESAVDELRSQPRLRTLRHGSREPRPSVLGVTLDECGDRV